MRNKYHLQAIKPRVKTKKSKSSLLQVCLEPIECYNRNRDITMNASTNRGSLPINNYDEIRKTRTTKKARGGAQAAR
jgi:hypothetical protein